MLRLKPPTQSGVVLELAHLAVLIERPEVAVMVGGALALAGAGVGDARARSHVVLAEGVAKVKGGGVAGVWRMRWGFYLPVIEVEF